MKFLSNKPALKISLLYYIFGFHWVFLTDRLFFRSYPSHAEPVIPHLKGIIFVSVTGLLIFFLVHWQFKKIKALVDEKNQVIREREIIMKELNHRVHNNLQVIQSFIHLELSKLEEDELNKNMMKKLYMRLQTISAVHHNIYNLPDSPYVNLKKVLLESLPCYSGFLLPSDCPHLIHHVDNIDIHIDTAIPLALVINELLMNSCIHAYPEGKKGDVCLTVRKENDMIRGEVIDYGTGFSDHVFSEKGSLGLFLSHSLLAQVGGKLEKEPFNGKGAKICLTIPLPAEA